MKILEFDKMSTYGLLRNTKNNEYYFISGFQLLKTMLSCKSIKTRILSEDEFHKLKKPQKYFIDNSKLLTFTMVGSLAYNVLTEYISVLFFSNFQKEKILPVTYISSLVILAFISKRKEAVYKNNTVKVLQLKPVITDINSTKKRLRIFLGMYVIVNTLAIMATFNILFTDNVFSDIIVCLFPLYVMILAVQDRNLSFKQFN